MAISPKILPAVTRAASCIPQFERLDPWRPPTVPERGAVGGEEVDVRNPRHERRAADPDSDFDVHLGDSRSGTWREPHRGAEGEHGKGW